MKLHIGDGRQVRSVCKDTVGVSSILRTSLNEMLLAWNFSQVEPFPLQIG